MNAQSKLAELVASKRVVVCVGSGGVGKTTTSAVIALHAAMQGRRVLVLTIDPAKRLANSLGIDALSNDVTRIPIEKFRDIGLEPKGELWAMMLDMKESFDHVVRRYAPAKERKAILENRIYQYFSTSLAGTQEYAAAERLYELYEEGNFDLIVLDTPPTTHALDFLEAPKRLEDAVDNKALYWLFKPGMLAGRTGLGVFSTGTAYVFKTLSKFTGAELLEEFSTFLKNFAVLFEGLKERSRRVRKLLTGPESTFVVVTAPEASSLEEALYFHKKLGDEEVQVGGFVINRVRTAWVDAEDARMPAVSVVHHLAESGHAVDHLSPEDLRELAGKLLKNAQESAVLAEVDNNSIEVLRRAISRNTPIQRVPFFSTDIHSLRGLNLVRTSLFAEHTRTP
jgi:anion-transporting  ArsA/GET3 family ATPase